MIPLPTSPTCRESQVGGPESTDNQIARVATTSSAHSHSPTPTSVDTRNTQKDEEGDAENTKEEQRGKEDGKRDPEKAGGEEMIHGRPRDVYDKFTPAQKIRMTAIVSFSALLSRESLLETSSSLLPSPIQLSRYSTRYQCGR